MIQLNLSNTSMLHSAIVLDFKKNIHNAPLIHCSSVEELTIYIQSNARLKNIATYLNQLEETGQVPFSIVFHIIHMICMRPSKILES